MAGLLGALIGIVALVALLWLVLADEPAAFFSDGLEPNDLAADYDSLLTRKQHVLPRLLHTRVRKASIKGARASALERLVHREVPAAEGRLSEPEGTDAGQVSLSSGPGTLSTKE